MDDAVAAALESVAAAPSFLFAGGLAAVCPDDPDSQYEMVYRLREMLDGHTVTVFASLEPPPLRRTFSTPPRRPLVAVLPYSEPFDVLRACGTSGGDALSTETLIATLSDWRLRHPFTLYGADRDWLALEFAVPPSDALAFASEILAICPDMLDEETPTPQSLADDLTASRRLFLWWD